MRAKRFTSKYANQFRQDYLVYNSPGEQQFEHLMIRQFAGSEQEPAWLAEQLSQTIHDVPLIYRMIGIMEKDAIPQAELIVDYGDELNAIFTEFAAEESYTSTYYSNLVQAITDLANLAATFQRDTAEHLLDRLKTPLLMYRAPERVLDIDSDTISKIDDVIAYYLENFEAYDHYFCSANDQKHLSKLMKCIDAVLDHLQATREILFTWEMQLAGREEQELYN